MSHGMKSTLKLFSLSSCIHNSNYRHRSFSIRGHFCALYSQCNQWWSSLLDGCNKQNASKTCVREIQVPSEGIVEKEILSSGAKSKGIRIFHLTDSLQTVKPSGVCQVPDSSFHQTNPTISAALTILPWFQNFKDSLLHANGTASVLRSNIRKVHSQLEFSLQNELFSKYIASLMEEFTHLSENVPSDKMEGAQVLRMQFLRPVSIIVGKMQAKEAEMEELVKLIKEESDGDMRELIEKELLLFKEEIDEIGEELAEALVGEDLADSSNDIIVEINAGVGGQEAMLFASEVLDMYCNFALYRGWTLSDLQQDEAESGGARKAMVTLSGEGAYKCLKHEAGVHRVQRVPRTERQGRIHTSTISVSILPKPREIDVVLNPKDLKVETMRGSGPGGQSVNTTDSAVRITHLPTGTVADARQERSQIKNREIAMEKLKMRIYQDQLDEQESKRRSTRKMQMGTRGRSEKIRTYNFQQDRISDHRVKENLSNLKGFMEGNEQLENLISSLEKAEKYSALASMVSHYEDSLRRNKKS